VEAKATGADVAAIGLTGTVPRWMILRF